MSRNLLALLVLSTVAAAPPPAAPPARELRLADAPPAVQQAVRAEPSLAAEHLEIDALEVQERDLDHDGRAEWLVVADLTDPAGLHPVNRPLWLFRQSAQAGSWRLVDFLGYQLKAEPLPHPGAWDDLRLLAKDGVRQRCTLLGWERDHYQKRGCCDPRTGAAAPCP